MAARAGRRPDRDEGAGRGVCRPPIEADYIAPARFDDALVVETRITALTPARIVMAQDVARDGAVLFSASVTIVCVGAHGRATRIPEAVRAALAGATDLA